MKRIHILIVLVFLVAILQACSKQEAADVVTEVPIGIPLPVDVQSILILNPDGTSYNEHRDAAVIGELLQGMKEAKSSYVGDPEQSGALYKIILTGSGEKRIFSINDLSNTSAADVSVKLYEEAPDGGTAKAWSLPTAWIQLLLRGSVDDAGPGMLATVDEDNDSVTVVANREMDEQSIKDAIEATLMVAADQANTTVDYAISVTDPRRIVIRFPDLPQRAVVQFNLAGAKTKDGRQFLTHSSDGNNAVTIRQGVAWSGLRWLDTTGAVRHEHGLDSARLIEPSRDEAGRERELLIYNEDRTVYRVRPEQGEIEDVTVRAWLNEQEKYGSEYGVNTLYSYPDEHDRFYAAKGLQTIYKVSSKDGTSQPIYESDRPIYGVASSPDGKHVALLVDTEHLGPDADLIIIDAKGKVVSTYAKAAYMGHSEGFYFIYPLRWVDNETIEVPLVNGARGTALYDYKKGLQSKEENTKLPEKARQLLQSKIGEQDDIYIARVLPKPDDGDERYYAVYVAGVGSLLIDLQEKKVTLLGSGALLMWTSTGQIVVWHSTAGKDVEYIGVD
ncbi:hypothetical protein DFQ01_10581 [Paenibacillus cellulosilyticus]|uniref:Uncharacterized protein n=1 Tax=Paenibacillus cellulosilyticus TaxID=375489 RepID=A0A2V2YVC8_9BACL|nr:hypothetical protein [Paenibacillus cellulosilyticus]PWW05098.1 hypothetical protein DFQ01_10581 [Paenibacillus cellulosilyticus]QKS48650.1 hypothetical protein HUB94_31075 [Paenibacillus cellulosilyticus]